MTDPLFQETTGSGVEQLESTEKFPLLEALMSDRRSREAMDQLWLAAQMFIARGGAVPMNRYLKLPATPGQRKIAARNLWLVRAAGLLPDGNGSRAGALHSELEAFVSRGPWRSWKSHRTPPDAASELRKAFFMAMKFNDGHVPVERQIYRILAGR